MSNYKKAGRLSITGYLLALFGGFMMGYFFASPLMLIGIASTIIAGYLLGCVAGYVV